MNLLNYRKYKEEERGALSGDLIKKGLRVLLKIEGDFSLGFLHGKSADKKMSVWSSEYGERVG